MSPVSLSVNTQIQIKTMSFYVTAIIEVHFNERHKNLYCNAFICPGKGIYACVTEVWGKL